MKRSLLLVVLAAAAVTLVASLDATLNCTNAELNYRTIQLLETSPLQISSLNLTAYNYPTYVQQVCASASSSSFRNFHDL